jgi:parvulin-like peptidyl-prolyl isomerase
LIVRRLWLALTALLLLASCGSLPEGIEAHPPTPEPDDAIAKITYRNGMVEYISRAAFDQFQEQLSQLAGSPVDPEFALNQMIGRRLLLHQAHILDVVADGQSVQRVVDNLRGNPQFCGSRVQQVTNDSRAFFDACARSFGFEGELAFRSFIAEELTINQVAQQQAPKDLIRAAHILLESHEQAAEVYDRVQRRGVNFMALARELSIEPGAKQSGGELPPFNEQGATEQGQSFDPTFVSRAWELRPQFERTGEAISEPFQTEFGWHIVKILGLEASQESVAQYREAILERALNAEPADLQKPDTGDVPLIGVVEILQPLPTPEELPPVEPVLPQATPTPETTDEAPVEASPGASPEAPEVP